MRDSAAVGSNLADLVKAAADARPDHPAIFSAGRKTTWAELDRLVHALSGGLIARRLGRGDHVAIVLGNSLEFVTSYFGTLRAGLVAVPLNPGYTATELRVLLNLSGAKFVITDRSTSARVREAVGDIDLIEVGTDDWRRLMVGSMPPFAEPTDPESLAVLLFTSGTSGKPKGAMLTHRALLANLDQLGQLTAPAPLEPDDVCLVILPMFHIYALNAGLGMIVKNAATMYLTDRFDPEQTLEFIEACKITNVAGAPPMYVAWAALPDLAERFKGVRFLASGAAPLPATVFNVFARAGIPIWEGYGMTETSPVIATTAASGKPKAGFVGKPLPGVEVKLVDSEGNEVDENDPGELLVRGANVFSGYWPDGHDGPDTEGWFATGDVAIADEEHDLRLVDRRRDLILVSGFNVYPHEVEAALSMAPGVAEVAVVGVSDAATGEAVKAIVVAHSGIDLTPQALLDFGAQHLARFKLPTVVEVVAALPHSVTGKVMKGTLRGEDVDAVDIMESDGMDIDPEPADASDFAE